MLDIAKLILATEGIDRVGIVNINECEIINQRIMPEGINSAVMFCIPYRTAENPSNDGFSEYARTYDYHKFSSELYSRILSRLESESGEKCFGFCDHSAINEKLAAAKSGLGVIGKNSLFIDDIYGSYVFLGSILTTAKWEAPAYEVRQCQNCGACISACPAGAMLGKGIDRGRCLSAISQKKNKTDEEKAMLREKHIAWGCDICQSVCPHNINARVSPLPYFEKSRVPFIDMAFIESLTDDEFKKYAFSYRGRQTILNNLEIL